MAKTDHWRQRFGNYYHHGKKLVAILLVLDLLAPTDRVRQRFGNYHGKKLVLNPVPDDFSLGCWVAPTGHERQRLGTYHYAIRLVVDLTTLAEHAGRMIWKLHGSRRVAIPLPGDHPFDCYWEELKKGPGGRQKNLAGRFLGMWWNVED